MCKQQLLVVNYLFMIKKSRMCKQQLLVVNYLFMIKNQECVNNSCACISINELKNPTCVNNSCCDSLGPFIADFTTRLIQNSCHTVAFLIYT